MSSGCWGPPIDVRPLLSAERERLLDLLGTLGEQDWRRQTACPGWSVHDIAVHLLHDDLRRLAAQRDGHVGTPLSGESLDDLATALDAVNGQWVDAVASSVSPRLVCELLAWSSRPSEELLTSLDPGARESVVAWAGPGPHPNWLDVAREFTERWVHHQQIREAVDQPPLSDDYFLTAVVETFARALPAALPHRPGGTQVRLSVEEPNVTWTLRCDASGWIFASAPGDLYAAEVTLPATVFWRRAVRMLDHNQARAHAQGSGDLELVKTVLDLRSIIVVER